MKIPAGRRRQSPSFKVNQENKKGVWELTGWLCRGKSSEIIQKFLHYDFTSAIKQLSQGWIQVFFLYFIQ